jgi:hypothetical protein
MSEHPVLVRDNILCQLTLESPWTHPPIFQLIAGAALKGARIVIDLSFFSVLLLTYPWHAFLKRRQGKCFTALEGTNDGHELLIPQKKKEKKKTQPQAWQEPLRGARDQYSRGVGSPDDYLGSQDLSNLYLFGNGRADESWHRGAINGKFHKECGCEGGGRVEEWQLSWCNSRIVHVSEQCTMSFNNSLFYAFPSCSL